MIALVAITMVVAYLVLDRSGLLDEFIQARRRQGGRSVRWRARRTSRPGETDRRLEVFKQFIEELGGSNGPEDDEEEE